jgi:hypothetical protein
VSEDHALVVAQKGPLRVALFPDGTYTSDISGARSGAVTTGLPLTGPSPAASGTRPENADHGQPTPSRMQTLDKLVAQGVLTKQAAEGLASDGRVRDHAWSLIKDLASGQIDPAGIMLTTLDRWTLAFQTAAGVSGLDFEPLQHQDTEPPYAAILKALDTLRHDSWRLVQVSEDREVDVEAERSFIVAIRYLLVRG